jgi:multiple sugar transport system substrate-binding protein
MTRPQDRLGSRRGGRRAGVMAALLLTAGTLAACGGGGSDSGQEGDAEKAELTFVNAQDKGTFDKVIAGFQKENPGITIKQQVVPFDDLNSTVQSRLQNKDDGIDLYDVDEPRLASFASRGYLLELDDISGDGIDEKAMEATKYDGKQYAMPRWTSTQLLFYNKKLLKDAGIDAPGVEDRLTWEQVTSTGAEAKQAGAKWGLTFDQVDRYYQLQPLAESLGGGPGLKGDGLLEPDVTNEGWEKAFSWYGSTFEEELSPRGIAAEQTGPLFAQGETAFFAGGPWNRATFDEAGVDYGVAPFPMFEGGEPASSTGSWATGVSPFSKNQAAAKKFIEYMTTTSSGAWEASSNNIPVQEDARKQYLDEMRSGGGVGPQLADVVENELDTSAVSRPTTVAFVDFETIMNKAFADIRNGTPAPARLQDASTELESALKKYQG